MSKMVLVTGAGGFIGSHLVESLVKKGYSVRALVEYNANNHWGWLEESSCKHDIDVRLGDVRDSGFCLELCKGVDYVLHLAALIGIPYSYAAPRSYIETNILGTVNMCEAALKNNVEKIIHTSTSEVYGTAQYVPIDEAHPLQPQSPYSASKISADAMAMSYHNSFKLPVVIARPFNTYGPRQSARAVIPTIISQIASGVRSLSLGNLTPTRNFNYVLDTVLGFESLLKNEVQLGEAYNIGSESEISIGDLVFKIAKLMDVEIEVKEDSVRLRNNTSEVYRLSCDAKKLYGATGYVQKYDLEQGLRLTIGWLTEKKNLNQFKENLYVV